MKQSGKDDKNGKKITRRDFIKRGTGLALVAGVSALSGFAGLRALAGDTVWQIDPDKCTQCGKCATSCVQNPSAVKCVHAFALCGYCVLCSGFYKPNTRVLDTAAENRQCPTGAITRTFIEDPTSST